VRQHLFEVLKLWNTLEQSSEKDVISPHKGWATIVAYDSLGYDSHQVVRPFNIDSARKRESNRSKKTKKIFAKKTLKNFFGGYIGESPKI
jgi:hypothetical protein